MKTLLDNKLHKIELEDGIVIATLKTSTLDLDIAKEILSSRLKVTSGHKYPFLIKMKSIQEATEEARNFFASEEACEDVIAGALCVDSVVGNYISTFFVVVNKPLVPMKIFNDEKEAKGWLEQFVVKDKTGMN